MEDLPDILLTFALCLGFTVILEELTALILGVRRKYDLLMILLVNIITNPPAVLLNMGFASFTALPEFLYVAVLEILVVVVEWLFFKRMLDKQKVPLFLMSLILNLVSFAVGTPIIYAIQKT